MSGVALVAAIVALLLAVFALLAVLELRKAITPPSGRQARRPPPGGLGDEVVP